MLNIERTLVNTESAYTANEIENRKLEQLHSQLESFNLQATLIVGFAFTTMNADNLVALGDDVGKFCIYKRPVLAHIYVVLTLLAIGLSMSSVMLSTYIIWKSQRSANDVSVRLTIALVRTLKMKVMITYFIGMGAFMFAFLTLIWIYIGQFNWVPLEVLDPGSATPFSKGYMPGAANNSFCGPQTSMGSGFTQDPSCDTFAANGWDTPVVTTDKGDTYVTCLNPYYASHQQYQRDVGFAVASAGTLACLACVAFTIWAVLQIRAQFRNMEVVASRPGGPTLQVGGRDQGVEMRSTDERPHASMLNQM